MSAVTTSPSPLMDVVSARPRQPSVPGSAEAARGREGCGRRRAALLSRPPSSPCRALSAGALEDFLAHPPRCCPGDFAARRREPCTPGWGVTSCPPCRRTVTHAVMPWGAPGACGCAPLREAEPAEDAGSGFVALSLVRLIALGRRAASSLWPCRGALPWGLPCSNGWGERGAAGGSLRPWRQQEGTRVLQEKRNRSEMGALCLGAGCSVRSCGVW